MVKTLVNKAVIIVFIGGFLFTSCKFSGINRNSKSEGRFMAKIHTSAGDHMDRAANDTLNFMAFPFNVAEFTGKKMKPKKVFIVGKSIDEGQRISFHPIAKLSYDDGEKTTVIVARPTNPELMTAPVDNYFDLISLYYGVQKVIETWLTYAKGFDALRELEWENEDSAIEFLDS